MKKTTKPRLKFEIDKLTRSIENAVTGESFKTEVSQIDGLDLKGISKRNGWEFNWKLEFDHIDREVFKLSTSENPQITQGLISLQDVHDHVFVHLLESAPFNRGKQKVYVGVPGNLMAFACLRSFRAGRDGYVIFTAKTKLIHHYVDILKAKVLKGQRMVIEPGPLTNL